MYSRESWQVIEDSFRAYCTEPSFVDYFWTIRTMHAPLFTLAEIAKNMPRVKMVHSISTGYAGLLGAMVSDRYRIPYLISEHGIYTKERKIDLSQAQWIDDPEDQVSAALNDQLGYIRRLWIRFFEVVGRLAYQKADSIVSLYSGNQLASTRTGGLRRKKPALSRTGSILSVSGNHGSSGRRPFPRCLGWLAASSRSRTLKPSSGR